MSKSYWVGIATSDGVVALEAFGTERMQTLTADEVNERVSELQRATRFDATPVPLRA